MHVVHNGTLTKTLAASIESDQRASLRGAQIAINPYHRRSLASAAGEARRRLMATTEDHEDHDDFYQRVQRENENGDPSRWLPTQEDKRLLKRETAARLLTEWELGVQDQVLNALREVQTGGSIRFEVRHPLPDKGLLATVTLNVVAVRESGYEADEIDLEITPVPTHAGTHLTWQFTVRTLISLSPPEQDWYRVGNT